MTKIEAIDYFGGTRVGVAKMAEALGITVQAIYAWPDEAIPMRRQYELERLTKGRLKADKRTA